MGLEEGKGEEKRQPANGEVLCRSLNPSWSPQVGQRKLRRSGSLGTERDNLEKIRDSLEKIRDIGSLGKKEGKRDEQEEICIFLKPSWTILSSAPEMRNSAGEGAAHTP